MPERARKFAQAIRYLTYNLDVMVSNLASDRVHPGETGMLHQIELRFLLPNISQIPI